MRRRHNITGDTEPNAIDPRSGFKVKLSELRKEWTGDMIYSKFWDPRHPQDFVRGVKDRQNLPYSRPEVTDTFLAEPILWENGAFLTTEDGGDVIYQEGLLVSI